MREYEMTHRLGPSTPHSTNAFRPERGEDSGEGVEGIITVYGLESYQHTLVMVLEDFGGDSLARLLPEHPLAVDEFLRLAIRITDILGHIHQQQIMHKDINPTNIVWNPETHQVKIIDFGISTELSREQPEIRNPNVLEGTLAYMSPEQIGRMNRAMDYRTDFYSLGATFYHLVTGQLPFEAEDAQEMVHCHLAKMPVPPCDLVGAHRDAPSVEAVREPPLQILSDIILKLMAKNAEDRYQSAFGLKMDLECCLTNLRGLEDPSTGSGQALKGFTLG